MEGGKERKRGRERGRGEREREIYLLSHAQISPDRCKVERTLDTAATPTHSVYTQTHKHTHTHTCNVTPINLA